MTTDHRPAELSPVKRALLELREMRAKLDAVERERAEPIAIVGMGCRFPGGVEGPDGLWRLLRDGVDAIREVPADRWPIDDFFDADPSAPGRMSTRWGGFVDGIDRFDPGFFGISPREAMAMDPQQRLLLEVAWEALEHAGQAPDRLSGTATGVFTGISSFDYVHLAMGAPLTSLDSYLAQGIAHSAASGRLAYALGLQGPALSIDTACSSSLMAVHLAVQSLRRGECSMALAGGVNAILLPTFLIGFSKSQMMAADGRCKSFDAAADGFVRGEGCGVVVLKRLSDALADRDRVWAVVRGTAANQDGRSSGLTAPNGLAQEAVLRAALADARVQPAEIGYVEAHGTGTSLGDPIELQALGTVMGRDRRADRPLLVGSLKTNLGHMEAAAGVAGVIKAALALRHGEIPPSLHFREPNPFIPWGELPVAVAAELAPFPAFDGRRLAGVSSFGFTGTNVHVVLENAPAEAAAEIAGSGRDGASVRVETGPTAAPADKQQPDPTVLPLRLLKLAARDGAALDRLVERWTGFLDGTDADWTDICFTASTGRADLPVRLAVVAGSAAEARTKLVSHASGEPVPGVLHGIATAAPSREIAFLFSGHGSQFPGMARGLYRTQASFRAALDECDALLRPHLPRPLLSVLFPDAAGAADSDSLLLRGMTYSQPALFAVEYALAQMWRAWGVEPAAVLGHSVGEYAAATVAGVFGLEDGLKLVAARGRLMDSLERRGAMLAVFVSVDEVGPLVRRHAGAVSVAAINGPTEVVLSGEVDAIDAIQAEVDSRGVEFRRLAVAQAGHSHLLDPILDEFEDVAATVRFRDPRVPLVSCTTGRLVAAGEVVEPGYWRRHLRETVRFADAVGTLHDEGCGVFLELGPHTALAAMGSRCLPDAGALWLGSLRRDWDDRQQVLETAAALYTHGVAIDWAGFEADQPVPTGARRARVPLPTNPWTHRRYWLEHAAVPGTTISLDAAPPERQWASVVEAGRRQESQGPLDLDLPAFPGRWLALSALSTAMIAATLRDLDAFPAGAVSGEALAARAGILPRYARLLERWLQRLESDGLVRRQPGGWVAADTLAAVDLPAAWRQAEDALADWGFMLDYLRRCGDLLPAVVTGRANPLETIFPGGSFDSADQLYRDSILPRYFNAVAGAVVAGFADARGGRPVRLLEVGGGTGGTTGTLVPIVERTGGTYHFSDVSDLFLARAAERFGAHPCMRFGLFDIDRDAGEQGYAPGSFDVIVAANVVHAVSDIPGTLHRLRSLLAPGGLLMLVEVTRYLDWFDVSTALLEGWDRQVDDLRGDHPMLSAEVWRQALRDAGFAEAAAFPGPGSPAEVMAQHVLLAQAPLATGTLAVDEADAAQRDDRGRPAAVVQEVQTDAFAARLEAAAPHEREDLLVEYVRNQIAALLRLESPQLVERRGRLMELGLDSLMAVELRSRLGRGLPLAEPLPATLVFDFPTVDAIVSLLDRLLTTTPARSNGEAVPPPEAARREPVPVARVFGDATPDTIDDLSDDEVEARLLARLEEFEERAR